MDPVSLALGVVSASETAFSVSKFLTTTWKSYRNAPEEILEIAHEVNICRCLMTPFGERLKTGSTIYTAEFQSSVLSLIENSRKTFKDIEKLVPSNGTLDRGSLRRWTYVLQKSEVTRHRKRLKQIQQIYIFMKEMMVEAQTSTSNRSPYAAGSSGSPIVLTGSGMDPSGASVTYTATISMQPTNPIPQVPSPSSLNGPNSAGPDKQSLNAIRQSPYFSSDLLQKSQNGDSQEHLSEEARKSSQKRTRFQDRENAKRKSSVAVDTEMDVFELPSDLDASRDVDRLLENWFGNSTETRPSAPASASTPDKSRSDFTPPKSPDKPPSPQLTSSISTAQTPTSPTGPRPDSSTGYHASEGQTIKLRCDSCKDKIVSTHYDCKSCDDFHLCKQCYDDPKITLRLRHRHPTTYFVEKR